MPVESKGAATDVGRATGTEELPCSTEGGSLRAWHEPDYARVSSPDLVIARGEIPGPLALWRYARLPENVRSEHREKDRSRLVRLTDRE